MNCIVQGVVERVNYDEVKRSVRSMRKKKSPGLDVVTPKMMAVVWGKDRFRTNGRLRDWSSS